jgi:hypothetical protein
MVVALMALGNQYKKSTFNELEQLRVNQSEQYQE